MPPDWELSRPTGTCSACAKPFAVDERYCSALFDEPAGFVRREYCLTCWEKDRPAAFSFWQARVRPPDEKPKLLVDDDIILNFFHRLEPETDPLKLNFRYIVALILMRKRVLKFDTTERDGDKEFWVLRLTRDKTNHKVFNPHLTEEEIQRLSEEVGQLLNLDA